MTSLAGGAGVGRQATSDLNRSSQSLPSPATPNTPEIAKSVSKGVAAKGGSPGGATLAGSPTRGGRDSLRRRGKLQPLAGGGAFVRGGGADGSKSCASVGAGASRVRGKAPTQAQGEAAFSFADIVTKIAYGHARPDAATATTPIVGTPVSMVAGGAGAGGHGRGGNRGSSKRHIQFAVDCIGRSPSEIEYHDGDRIAVPGAHEGKVGEGGGHEALPLLLDRVDFQNELEGLEEGDVPQCVMESTMPLYTRCVVPSTRCIRTPNHVRHWDGPKLASR